MIATCTDLVTEKIIQLPVYQSPCTLHKKSIDIEHPGQAATMSFELKGLVVSTNASTNVRR